jgi:hypothetical protein
MTALAQMIPDCPVSSALQKQKDVLFYSDTKRIVKS